MSTTINVLFMVGNIIMSVGTLLLILTVIKNRSTLNGYNLLGSFLIFIPCVIFGVCYYLMDNYLTLLFSLITTIFWMLVTIILIKKKVIK